MWQLPLDPCTSDEIVCTYVQDVTGNVKAAWVVDFLIGRPLAIAWLILLFFLIRWLLNRLVDRVIKRAESGALTAKVGRLSLGAGRAKVPNPTELATATRRVQRAKAMGSLLKSIITGALVAVFGTMILAEIGINVGPIIASAGIVGIALGFGAQSLVSDYLSGVFMVFEDQYGVGDEVDLGEAIGTVEAVSLRVTRVRDINGTVWYVRNGEIVRVGNMSQNWARSVIDVSVAYQEDLARVRRVLEDVAHDMWEDEDYRGVIIEEPSVWGVQELGADGVVVRVALKTAPLEQWAVARQMRQRIKTRFDHEGIEIPYQQRVVWHRSGQGDVADLADEVDATPSGPTS